MIVSIHSNWGYVWNGDDALELVFTHRMISDSFVGTLSTLPQQNAVLGLPLLLMPEQVHHLSQKGVILQVTTNLDTPRMTVFAYLTELGYIVACGSKFGADYVVYEDFPWKQHARYAASAVTPYQSMSFLGLVGETRLGTAARKAKLVCASEGKVMRHVFVLEWAGF
jgi:hypothetical protein